MFVLFSISRKLEFSYEHSLTYENFESKGFKHIKFSGEIPINWPNYLLGTHVYKTLELCWWLLQCIL